MRTLLTSCSVIFLIAIAQCSSEPDEETLCITPWAACKGKGQERKCWDTDTCNGVDPEMLQANRRTTQLRANKQEHGQGDENNTAPTSSSALNPLHKKKLAKREMSLSGKSAAVAFGKSAPSHFRPKPPPSDSNSDSDSDEDMPLALKRPMLKAKAGKAPASKGPKKSSKETSEQTCPEFGEGWIRMSRQRGESTKHVDHYYVSPDGKTFNSRPKVLKHLGLEVDPLPPGGGGGGKKLSDAARAARDVKKAVINQAAAAKRNAAKSKKDRARGRQQQAKERLQATAHQN